MNRRDLLRGAALASVAAAVPIAPSSAIASPDRSAWDAAMLRLRHAEAASEAFEPKIHAISSAYRAAVAEVPHVTLRPDPHSGRTDPVTTADEWFVKDARRLVAEVKAGKCRLETDKYQSLADHWQLCLDTKAAADARDAEIQRIDERTGYSAGHEHYDALQTAMCDAETVLLNLPAPDGEALLWKIERLYKPGDGVWSKGVEDQTHADLRRFLSNGRA